MIKEYLADLALDAGKAWIGNQVDERKLRSALLDYIEKQRKYNEVSDLAGEMDFQGIIEYIKLNFLDDVNSWLFALSKEDRGQARSNIIAAAINCSKANTDQAMHRVAKCISDCLNIIQRFYTSGVSKKDYLFAAKIVDAVGANTQRTAEESAQAIISRIDDMESNLANGSLFSVDKAIQLAEAGKLSTIESGFTKMLDHISHEHRLYPYYGYTYDHGHIQSKALTKEAKELFPPKCVFTGAIRFGEEYYNDPDGDPLNYAYRHQLPIIMEVEKAVKYLGNIPDPVQLEVSELPGKVIQAVPPEFPPAFPCSIKVGDEVFFDYILFRTQEILDDGTYVISNKEQDIYFHFEMRIDPKAPAKSAFNININTPNNHEALNCAKFKKALSQGGDIHIYALEAGQDMIAGHINNIECETESIPVDEKIDFLDRVCAIEDYFNVSFNLTGTIRQEEYDAVVRISDLIRNDETSATWSEVTITGIVSQHFREQLMEMDKELNMLTYVGINVVELFGTSFEFRVMTSFKCAYMVDYEKTKQKAAILDDGDSIKVTFRAGEDNTVIETLNIPKQLNTHFC